MKIPSASIAFQATKSTTSGSQQPKKTSQEDLFVKQMKIEDQSRKKASLTTAQAFINAMLAISLTSLAIGVLGLNSSNEAFKDETEALFIGGATATSGALMASGINGAKLNNEERKFNALLNSQNTPDVE